MASTLLILVLLILLIAAAAACALTPLVAFVLILWSWRSRPDRVPRQLRPE